jgi:hypothetical protein
VQLLRPIAARDVVGNRVRSAKTGLGFVSDLVAGDRLAGAGAGAPSGIVLVARRTTETVPFTGFLLMLTSTGIALQLASHARAYAMRLSTPESADRARLRAWATLEGVSPGRAPTAAFCGSAPLW